MSPWPAPYVAASGRRDSVPCGEVALGRDVFYTVEAGPMCPPLRGRAEEPPDEGRGAHREGSPEGDARGTLHQGCAAQMRGGCAEDRQQNERASGDHRREEGPGQSQRRE